MTVGPLAIVMVDFVASSSPHVLTTIGTLPEGVRPAFYPSAQQEICAALAYRGASYQAGMLQINADGEIMVYTPSTDKYYSGQIAFPIARQ